MSTYNIWWRPYLVRSRGTTRKRFWRCRVYFVRPCCSHAHNIGWGPDFASIPWRRTGTQRRSLDLPLRPEFLRWLLKGAQPQACVAGISPHNTRATRRVPCNIYFLSASSPAPVLTVVDIDVDRLPRPIARFPGGALSDACILAARTM